MELIIPDEVYPLVTNSIGFEIRLDRPDCQPDISIDIPLNCMSLELLLKQLSIVNAPNPYGAVATIINSTIAAPLGMDSVWLEFDAPVAASSIVCPGVFLPLRLRPRLKMGKHAEIPPKISVEFIRGLIQTFNHVEYNAAWQNQLERILIAIPQNVFELQIGFFFGRNSRTIRLGIVGIRSHEIGQFLSVVGWPGCANVMTQVWPLDIVNESILSLHLDLDPEVAKTIGLELHLNSDMSRKGNDPRCRLMEWLIAQHLCNRETAELLYYTASEHGLADYNLPPRIRNQLSAPSRKVVSQTRFHHLKLTLSKEKEIAAKGYILKHYHWMQG